MRTYRLASLTIVTILIAAIIVIPVFSATSSSQVLAPLSLTTLGGATSGSLPALGLLEQSNTDDNPSTYLSFSTPSVIYSGYTTYQLPLEILPNKISALLLQVNFKGPADSTQLWTWSVFNWKSQLWIKVGDTLGTQPNVWNDITFRLRNFSPFISSSRQIRIRLQSNNANADAKLDYQAIHVTYIPVAPTATRSIATSAPTKDVLVLPTTVTPSPTLTPSITPSPTNTPTRTPTITRTPTSTSNAVVSTVFFPIAIGGSDVIPHQIVRTDADKLYIFVNQQGSQTLRVYYTTGTGLPDTASAFNLTPVTINEAADIISVDAVYGGGTIIHAIINTQGGLVKDYPFDTSTNTFKTAITLVPSGSGTIGGGGLYVGTSGVAGMVDLSGIIHFTYWTSTNHIMHRSYTYNSSTNTLTPQEASFTQVDTGGSANHPSVAVSPADGKLTVAWVSDATSPTRILTRTRDTLGNWGGIEIASTSDAWTSTQNGLNIDQGPSFLIDSTGVKHLIYIQEFDATVGEYGRVHYATNTGSGWVDTPLSIFSHDPVLGLSTAGNLYIIGHGHPENTAGSSQCILTSSSMDNMCYIKKNSNGTWTNPTLFATPPAGSSFDASPSVKWSVVGWNRSNAVEFIFFRTPYDTPTIYYGRLP